MTVPISPVYPEVPVPRANPKWLMPCGCVTALGLFVALPAIIWLVSNEQSARRVSQQLEKLQAAGEPLTAAELETWYRVPSDAVDTTALWNDVIRLLTEGKIDQSVKGMPIVDGRESDIPPPGATWAQLPEAGQLLVEFSAALDAMHAAGRVEHGSARFDTRFEDGYSMRLPHAQQVGTAARLLALEAHVQAHRGNVNGVVESLHSLLAAADSLENEPILISQIVRQSILGLAASNVCQLLPTCDFTDAQLDDLARHFARCDHQRGLTNGLRGERILGIEAIRNPDKVDIHIPRLPFVSDNLSLHLDLATQAAEASQKSFPEALTEIEKVEATLIRKIGQNKLQKMRYMIASMIVPAYHKAFTATARGCASSRMVQTLIAVEKFQRQEGRFPPRLTELTPKFLASLPLDPGDGKPLRCISGEAAFKIYSVGGNRIDDGGQVSEKDDVLTLQRRAVSRAPTHDEQK